MTTSYDPSVSKSPYYATGTTREISRLWSIEKTLHDLGEIGAVSFFEGSGDNPTGLDGYAIDKLWLRVSQGITTTAGEVRAYVGSGSASLLANWPEMTASIFARHIWEHADLGTFSGSTISDNPNVKEALQDLETALEAGGIFLQSGTGAVSRTLQGKMRDAVSVLDFIPVAEHAAILAGTSTTAVGSYIQAALDAHKHVHFPAGVYITDGVELEPQSGARIYGPGTTKKLVAASGYLSDHIDIISKSDVQIIGMKFAGTRERAIYIEDSTDIVVAHCTTNDSSTAVNQGCTGIAVAKNSSRVSVVYNTFYAGQGAFGTGGDKTGNVDGVVDGVLFFGNAVINPDEEMVDINWDTTNFIIANNFGYNIGRRGSGTIECFDIGGGATGHECRNGIICNNVVVSCSANLGNVAPNNNPVGGILLKLGTYNCHVFGNKLYGASEAGTRGMTIENSGSDGNRVWGNEFIGFGAGMKLLDADNNKVYGNRFVMGGTASIGCEFSNSCSDNDVYDNTFDGFTTACQYNATNPIARTHFRDNIGTGLTVNGIVLNNAGSVNYTDLRLTGNTLTGSGASGTGVLMRDATDCDISGTRTVGFVGGVNINGDCARIKVRNVEARDSTGGGYYVAAPNSIITDCLAKDNATYGYYIQGAGMVVANLRAINNVASGTSDWQVYIHGDCEKLNLNNVYIDDDRGSKLARGIAFAGAIDNAIVTNINVAGYLTTAVNALGNIGASSIVENINYGQALGVTVVATDAAFTLTPYSSSWDQIHTGTLTADRTVTLSTTNARKGNKFKITRTGAGAFNLSIGGLKNLATNTWCEVTYNGSAWVLTAYGAL